MEKPEIDKEKNNYLPFETEDLIKIFNPKTYFKKERNKDNHKYWIPLISLYSGMRLNEICQLYCDDIMEENGIQYFNITDKRPDQHLKNRHSKRRVPIHPVLKQLGFMEQVNFAKKQKQERIFYSLKHTTKNRYAGSMSNAFRYYMDNVIEIRDPKKVFHSFRHTVRNTFLNKNVREELANIICGWSGVGTGSLTYLHPNLLKIKNIDKELKKLKYPEVEKMLLGR